MVFFSICIAFLLFGTIGNILANFVDCVGEVKEDDVFFFWFVIAVCALLWYIVVPLSVVVFAMFLLKLLTDKISQYIIKHINKHNGRSDDC